MPKTEIIFIDEGTLVPEELENAGGTAVVSTAPARLAKYMMEVEHDGQTAE